MPKKISDIALAKVPSFANRVSLFQSKLQITRHASGTIVDYSHALYKAVAHIGKLLRSSPRRMLTATCRICSRVSRSLPSRSSSTSSTD